MIMLFDKQTVAKEYLKLPHEKVEAFSSSFPRNCDIICLSLSRWDAPISSPALALAKELAKNNRVFYIDHPYSWKDYFKKRKAPEIHHRKNALLKGQNIYQNPATLPPNLTVVTTRITWPINFLPKGKLYDYLSKKNDKIVLDTVQKIINDFEIKEFIYINFYDPYFVKQFPDNIKPLKTVYQSMDDISQEAYTRKHGVRLEEEIIRNFDYTLCTSSELVRLKSPFSSHVYLHPNAADINLFKRALFENLAKPKELEGISTKIIGFTGSIEYRSDFILLKKIADAHSDKTIVFVGPIHTNEHIKAGLDKCPNVVFTGPKNIADLPAFLQHFDCVIIPYRKTKVTKSIYPLKINEYLAAGKPVVSTNFSEDIFSFRNVAYLADSHEEFIAAIDKAIEGNNRELQLQRLKVAEQNTWAVRVQQFWNIISKENLPS